MTTGTLGPRHKHVLFAVTDCLPNSQWNEEPYSCVMYPAKVTLLCQLNLFLCIQTSHFHSSFTFSHPLSSNFTCFIKVLEWDSTHFSSYLVLWMFPFLYVIKFSNCCALFLFIVSPVTEMWELKKMHNVSIMIFKAPSMNNFYIWSPKCLGNYTIRCSSNPWSILWTS